MKTKGQLLAVMQQRPRACQGAIVYVGQSLSPFALEIGLACPYPEWLIWLLEKRLTEAGRMLFASRLGVSCVGRGADELWRAGMLAEEAAALDRAVINDCWRAWCRS